MSVCNPGCAIQASGDLLMWPNIPDSSLETDCEVYQKVSTCTADEVYVRLTYNYSDCDVLNVGEAYNGEKCLGVRVSVCLVVPLDVRKSFLQ